MDSNSTKAAGRFVVDLHLSEGNISDWDARVSSPNIGVSVEYIYCLPR